MKAVVTAEPTSCICYAKSQRYVLLPTESLLEYHRYLLLIKLPLQKRVQIAKKIGLKVYMGARHSQYRTSRRFVAMASAHVGGSQALGYEAAKVANIWLILRSLGALSRLQCSVTEDKQKIVYPSEPVCIEL
jgi:hypothetical protein